MASEAGKAAHNAIVDLWLWIYCGLAAASLQSIPAASISLLRDTPDANLGMNPATVSSTTINVMKSGEAEACSTMDFPVDTSAAAAPAKAIMAIRPFVRCKAWQKASVAVLE